MWPPRARHWPLEHSSTIFLKLQTRHAVGALVIAHYVTNPDERPDHVFRHDCRFRTYRQGDFETTRWAVEKLTPTADVLLERVPDGPPPEHLVVLTDAEGNVLLQDYCSAERAALLMDAVGAPAVESERRIG
ncbi:MAG: hypothetical protein U0871_15410 [Gemmataceae bacterium]